MSDNPHPNLSLEDVSIKADRLDTRDENNRRWEHGEQQHGVGETLGGLDRDDGHQELDDEDGERLSRELPYESL